MTNKEPWLDWQSALATRDAGVVVMGLGAIGLALVRVLLEAGYWVTGVDTHAGLVEQIRAGESPMDHIPVDWAQAMAGHPRLHLVCCAAGGAWEPGPGKRAQVGVICVPTPLDGEGRPDLEPVKSATRSLAQVLTGPALVLLESTTYPGTTREEVAPLLGAGDLRLGTNAWVAFAPERVDPGQGDPAGRHAPRLVGGLDERSTELAQQFYASLGFNVQTTASAEVAEAAKLVENVYRAVNIALVNELKLSFAAQGIDIWEVLDAAQTKGFGYQRFDPGPGAGGSCIPVDPRYLEYFARKGGVPLRLVELAGEIDGGMAHQVVETLVSALKDRGIATSGARVLLMGLAYKPNVNITTESPSLRIAQELLGLGAEVLYSDPHVGETCRLPNGQELSGSSPTRELLESVHVVLYLTDHAAFDCEWIAKHAPLLIDTRGKKTLRQAGERYIGA